MDPLNYGIDIVQGGANTDNPLPFSGGRMKAIVPIEVIEQKILLINGQKMMLDSDLAALYGVTTKG